MEVVIICLYLSGYWRYLHSKMVSIGLYVCVSSEGNTQIISGFIAPKHF